MSRFHFGSKLEGYTDRLQELAKENWRRHIKEWAGLDIEPEAVLMKYPAGKASVSSLLSSEVEYVYQLDGEWISIFLYKKEEASTGRTVKAYYRRPSEWALGGADRIGDLLQDDSCG